LEGVGGISSSIRPHLYVLFLFWKVMVFRPHFFSFFCEGDGGVGSSLCPHVCTTLAPTQSTYTRKSQDKREAKIHMSKASPERLHKTVMSESAEIEERSKSL